MYALRLNRKKLLDIFSDSIKTNLPSGMNLEALKKESLQNDELYALWREKPSKDLAIPNIIVIPDGILKDFFAWCWTYIPSFRPFSAYIRILEFHSLDFLRFYTNPFLNKLENACISLILCEAYLSINQSEKESKLSPFYCTTTLAYALSKGLSLGIESQTLSDIYENWRLTRRITREQENITGFETLSMIFFILLAIKNINVQTKNNSSLSSIFNACNQLLSHGSIDSDLWLKLIKNDNMLLEAYRKLDFSREDRINQLKELFSKRINGVECKDDEANFAYGYIASQINPGSLSHLNLINILSNKSNSTVYWYALCAGLQKKNNILNSYGAVGRRVLREILRSHSIFDPPTSDISFSELSLYLDYKNMIPEIRTFFSTKLIVELIPCVTTTLVWPQKSQQQILLFPSGFDDLNRRNLLSEMEIVIKKTTDIYNKLKTQDRILERKKTARKKSFQQKS